MVGESGSGKTVTMLAALGLLPANVEVSGRVRFDDVDLLRLSERELGAYRGRRIAVIIQEALAALNPVQRIGDQIAEAITTHDRTRPRTPRAGGVQAARPCRHPHPEARAFSYPHELSGGMRERVVIAMALANDPEVLIANEPTTALDVTIQAQVLDVLRRVQEKTHTAIILVTHDLGIVAGLAQRVVVMYAGHVVESADVRRLFAAPAHPYTRGLLASLPALARVRTSGRLASIDGQPPSLLAVPPGCPFHPRCSQARLPDPCTTAAPELRDVGHPVHEAACHFAGEPLPVAMPSPVAMTRADAERPDVILEVRDLVKHFRARRGVDVHAVCGVSFDVRRGETLGVVGESGCGKTTTARLLLNLLPATSGTVRFEGQDVLAARGRTMRALRRHMQIVFQDPYASLNPRRSVRSIIAAPLRVHGQYGRSGPGRVDELLTLTGLEPAHADRFPHEFSGGQRQRIGIARALALDPQLVVLDEPVSALDVSVHAGIVNLLEDLQDRLGLTYIFIAHDLAVVGHIADRVAVMYMGKIVESGTRDEVFSRPSHPYTQALLAAVPIPDPHQESSRRRILLAGDFPSPVAPPSGCRFRTRCWKAQALCAEEQPALVDRGQGHPVACHFAEVTDVLP